MLQAALETAVQKLFEISGITTGDPELEAYKIRVMLAHVRLMGARNLPSTLAELVREKCESLVAMLAPILNRGRSSSSLGEESKVLNHMFNIICLQSMCSGCMLVQYASSIQVTADVHYLAHLVC